jgi:GNAT acetyltransferase-like protein
MPQSEIKAEEVVISLYNPVLQFEEVKKIWTDLLARCRHNFFLSWGWKEVWLKSLPKNHNLSLMVGFKNNIPIFAFFLGAKKKIRHGVFKTHQISVNATSIKYIDKVWIEFNTILMDSGISLSLGTLIQLLPIKDWDEFYFPRTALSYFSNFKFNINSPHNYNIKQRKIDSYYIDLNKVRDADMNYLSLISSNMRNKLRRSLKEYEKKGKVQVIVADTVDAAMSMLEELKTLHQKRWEKRGDPGAFSNDYFCEFHRNLIENRFNDNEIQFLHIKCGEDTIGYLYNFIFNETVLFYQSGFNYLPRNVFRPGLVSHYLAVLFNASKGLDYYDFLAGAASYKKSMSTDCGEMHDILVQKKKVRFTIEDNLREIYHSSRNFKNKFLNKNP